MGPEKSGRERERESLPYWLTRAHRDTFSLISYRYVKIPEPEADRFYPVLTLAAYPFSYPFFSFRPTFSHIFQAVAAHKIFSEKNTIFSGAFPCSLCNERLLTLLRAWPGGVFYIYGASSPAAFPRFFPEIRGPPGPSQRRTLSRRCRCVMPTI